MCGKGGISVGIKKGGLTISMYNVGRAWGRLCNTVKTSSDSIASYYAGGLTVMGYGEGCLGEGGPLVNIMFFM